MDNRASPNGIIRRCPVLTYFVLTFAISWIGALSVVAPQLVRHQAVPKMNGILMFPIMLIGPGLAGIILTKIVDGKIGLRNLFSRMVRARLSLHWYATLAIPPVLIVAVLGFLKTFVSPVYAPNRFFVGILFGIPAGFLEEIGWTGYAFHKMRFQGSGLGPSVGLGLLWSLWHLPVVDFLGTATPHGSFLLPFFLVFTLILTAMRVLIAWTYQNTNSVLLAQMLHVSSTSSLVLFGPPHVTASQEVIWYGFYGVVLWVCMLAIFQIFGNGKDIRNLTQAQPDQPEGAVTAP